MFAVATESLVGNGRTTCFWTDRWLHGSRLEDLALMWSNVYLLSFGTCCQMLT